MFFNIVKSSTLILCYPLMLFWCDFLKVKLARCFWKVKLDNLAKIFFKSHYPYLGLSESYNLDATERNLLTSLNSFWRRLQLANSLTGTISR